MMKKKIITGVLSVSMLAAAVCAGSIPVNADTQQNVIRIDIDEDTFRDFTTMYCYIYDATDESDIVRWGSYKGAMTQDVSSGVWEFDLDAKGIELNSEHTYCVVFSSDWKWQTEDLAIKEYDPAKDYTAVFSDCFTQLSYTMIPVFRYEWTGEYDENAGVDVLRYRYSQSSFGNGDDPVYCQCFDKTDESYTLWHGRMKKDEDAGVWRFDFGSHGLELIPGHAYDVIFSDGGNTSTTLTIESYERGKNYTAAFTGNYVTNEIDWKFAECQWIESNDEVLYGDINLDGRITVSDVTALQQHLVEYRPFNKTQRYASDTNGDGIISIEDATHLQKYLAEYDNITLGKQ